MGLNGLLNGIISTKYEKTIKYIHFTYKGSSTLYKAYTIKANNKKSERVLNPVFSRNAFVILCTGLFVFGTVSILTSYTDHSK